MFFWEVQHFSPTNVSHILIYIHVVYENNEKDSASFMATGSPSAPGL